MSALGVEVCFLAASEDRSWFCILPFYWGLRPWCWELSVRSVCWFLLFCSCVLSSLFVLLVWDCLFLMFSWVWLTSLAWSFPSRTFCRVALMDITASVWFYLGKCFYIHCDWTVAAFSTLGSVGSLRSCRTPVQALLTCIYPVPDFLDVLCLES